MLKHSLDPGDLWGTRAALLFSSSCCFLTLWCNKPPWSASFSFPKCSFLATAQSHVISISGQRSVTSFPLFDRGFCSVLCLVTRCGQFLETVEIGSSTEPLFLISHCLCSYNCIFHSLCKYFTWSWVSFWTVASKVAVMYRFLFSFSFITS